MPGQGGYIGHTDPAGTGGTGGGTAADIITDVTSFTKNLSAADTNVQKALNTLDQMSGGTGSSNSYYPSGWL